jgi:hypothetical protein
VRTLLVPASFALCACDSGHRIARSIRDATVPPQARTPSFDEPHRDGTTLRYRLDFARGEPDAPTRVLVNLCIMPD